MTDDLISGQAAIDAIEDYLDEYSGLDEEGYHGEKWCAMAEARMVIENLPSAQPKRKTGKWNGYNADNPDWLRDDGSPVFLTCSECYGMVMNNGSAHWNFCPNCGADMRGGQK